MLREKLPNAGLIDIVRFPTETPIVGRGGRLILGSFGATESSRKLLGMPLGVWPSLVFLVILYLLAEGAASDDIGA